ncbi:tetratricopeptide repeat protein [Pontibacter sp. G13]|uniref:tetratricopeptide repeat protein n=1 Tax=Pontibacter sp. G13 TaxID=3074898 RepID=UPI00288BEAD2|nr:tetratricopeptide repeat protein [Pontibacter sp. G13]WNJ20379.1 tetratricopeptide repeat protein [Pontibacter sp. G13]
MRSFTVRFSPIFILLWLCSIGRIPLQAQSNPDSLIQQIQHAAPETQPSLWIDLVKEAHVLEPNQSVSYFHQAIASLPPSTDFADLKHLWFWSGKAFVALGQTDSAMMHADYLITQGETQNAPSTIGMGALLKGELLMKARDHEAAKTQFERAHSLYTQIDETWGIYNSLNNQGVLFYYASDFMKAKSFFEACVALETKHPDLSPERKCARNLGNIYVRIGDYQKAIELYEISLQAAQATGNLRGEAFALTNMGVALKNLGDYNKALEIGTQALKIKEQLGDQSSIASSLRNLGVIHTYLGNDTLAARYYQESLEIDRRFDDKRGMATSILNLGNIYYEREEYQIAEGYYQEVLKLRQEMKDLHGEAAAWGNLASCAQSMGKSDRSLEFSHKSLQINHQIFNDRGKGFAHSNIGLTYYEIGQFDSAEYHLLEAKMIFDTLGSTNRFARVVLSLGEVYFSTDRWEEALDAASIAEQHADSIGDIKLFQTVAQFRAAVHEERGEFEAALTHFKQYHRLRDSLLGNDRDYALTEFDTQYKASQKEARIELLEERRKTQQMWLIIAVLGAALLGIIAFFMFGRNQLIKQQAQVIEQEKAKLDAANSKLKEMDEAKTRFFTNISHELRTPLTVIRGMSKQIETQPDQWLATGTQLIQRNTDQLLGLINQILDLRKLESGKLSLKPVQADFVHYLRYLAESFQSHAQSLGITLSFESSFEEKVMDFDPEKMQRIMTNLIGNAIKFTPRGGHVFVGISPCTLSANCIQIEVRDTGIGIAEDKLPVIFERFLQLDTDQAREGAGTGIGLALAKELVELMGGEIRVDSQLDRGTTFAFRLPATRKAEPTDLFQSESQELDSSSETEMGPIPQQSHQAPTTLESVLPKVLIVEDHPDVVDYLSACLAGQYQLLIARDGQEGIDLALEQVPDLIVSDVMMPNKTGFELCETLKQDQRTSHIPIVLLTARADDDSRLTGLRRGADAYLPKPFDQEELLIRLQNLHRNQVQAQSRYKGLDPQPNPPAQSESFELEDAFVSQLREILHAHLTDTEFKVPELCKAIGMSRTNLHRKITALTGGSISQFIRTFRLQLAHDKLTHTDDSISEISFAVGFNDPAYFSRVFAKEYGVPPSKFREQLS